jgi:hypothetical protein
MFSKEIKFYSKEERLRQLEIASQTLPFYHVLNFNLVSQGQNILKTIDNFTREYEIVSLMSSMLKSTISMTLNTDNLTEGYVPIRSVANRQGTNNLQIPLICPIRTDNKSQLNISVINKEQNAGNYDLVLLSNEKEQVFSKHYQEKIDEAKKAIETSQRLPYYYTADVTMSNATAIGQFSYKNNEKPKLLWAMSSSFTKVKLDIKTSWNNRRFSDGSMEIPIWAIAGNSDSINLASFSFPVPVFVPANGEISGSVKQLNAQNLEANGNITFILTTV